MPPSPAPGPGHDAPAPPTTTPVTGVTPPAPAESGAAPPLPAAAPPPGAPPVPESIWTRNFLLVSFANFGNFASFYLLLATLPLYIVSVGGTEAEAGAIMGVFALSALVMRPVIGSLVDRTGRKPLLVLSLAGMAVSSLLYLPATAIWALFLVRVLHGTAFAATSTSASTYMSELLPPRRRAEGVGFYGMFTNLALAIGPWLSLLLAQAAGFPPVFLVSASVATAGVVCALLLAPQHVARPAGPPRAWWRSLYSTAAARPALVLLCFGVAYAAQVSFLPLYAVGQGIDPGPYFTVYAIALIASRGIAGRVADRFGRSIAIVPGLLLASVAMALIALASNPVGLIVAGLVYALAFALVTPALNAIVVDTTRPAERGSALATFSSAMDIGIALGSFLWGWVVALAGFNLLYVLAALAPLAGLLAYLLVVRRHATPLPAGA